MQNIILVSTIGISIIAIIYALILSRLILKKSAGSKKMADLATELSGELDQKQLKNLKDFAMVTIVVSTTLIYVFGWQVAAGFFVASAIFALVDYYLLGCNTKFAVRTAQAAREDTTAIFNFARNSSVSSSLLLIAVGTLVLGGIYFAFWNLNMILAVALSATIVSFFSWRSGKSAVFASGIVLPVAAIAIGEHWFRLTGNKTAEIFPLAVFFALNFRACCWRVSTLAHRRRSHHSANL